MPKRPNPELIDDENPEWTEAMFKQARPAAEVLPELFGAKQIPGMESQLPVLPVLGIELPQRSDLLIIP